MAKQLAVHIRPGASPSGIMAILSLISDAEGGYASAKELLSAADAAGLGSYAELHSLPISMGLLDRTSGRIELSETGRALLDVRRESSGDILHFLFFTGWTEKVPHVFLSSWSYRECVTRYWEAASIRLNSAYLDRVVEETISAARDRFLHDTEQYDEISFGRGSLEGARKYLEALSPPVLDGDAFSRRYFCPPELLILALAHIYSDDPDLVGTDVLLTQARRDALCRLCLLEPDALDRTLDWALGAFPHLVEKGTTAGTYGRFLRFRKVPTLTDLVQ